MKSFRRMLLMLAVALLPVVAQAQVYVGDYSFTTYTGSYASIAYSGTHLTALDADDASAVVSLPFTFEFGQDTCSHVTVTSNGQIGIGSANPASSGYNEHLADMNIIVPLGLDMDLDASSGGGHVYYELTGTAPNRVMVIEYDHVQPYTGGGSSDHYSFQVLLYESGDIEFIYDSCVAHSTQPAYVFLREHSVNSALCVAGSWSNPIAYRTISAIGLRSTDTVEPGLTFLFTRPYNNCPRPLNFVCRSFSRADSVVFAWNTDPSTSLWELRYDTVGTPVDSMVHTISTPDSFYTCTSMVVGAAYDVYVRTDCGVEQSFWEGPLTVTPGAYNMAATGTDFIYACGGMIYDNGGPSGNYTNSCNSVLTIYPSHPDSVVVVSGTLSTESCCDYLTIYEGVGTSGTQLYTGRGLNQTIPTVRSTAGPLTLRFYSDGSVINSGFALSVSCERAPACRFINSAEIDHIAGASAWMSWTLIGSTANPSHYVVTLVDRTDSTAAPIQDTTSQLYYFLQGLTPSNNYIAYVNSICGADTIVGDSVEFSTRCLVGGTTNPSGTDLTTTTGVPVTSGWGNTFCQSIYTAADLSAMGLSAGPINGITYTWNSAGSYDKEIVIFLGQTTNSTFASGSFAPLTGSMTQVYSGIRTHTSDNVGTIEYYFTTPFVWDGVSNLVVSSFVNQPSGETHGSSGFSGYCSNCGSIRTIYGYKDATAYNLSNLNTNNSTGTSSYRPNIQFIKPCDTTVTCAGPNVVVTELLDDSVTVVWAPGYTETAWNLSYRPAGDTAWTTVANNYTGHQYTFTGLSPMTEYVFRVSPDCSEDMATMVSVTTPCVPIAALPFTEDFESFTAASSTGSPITNCWHRGTTYPSTSYPYLSTSYANSGSRSMYFYASGTTYSSWLVLPPMAASLDSLQVSFAARHISASYSIQLGVMTDPNDFSTFTQLATFTPPTTTAWEMYEQPLSDYTGNGMYIAFACTGATSYMYLDDIEVDYLPTCQRPHNISVTGITTNTATVHWTGVGSTFFEMEYGPSGFRHGSGLTVTSNTDSTTLYGLAHSTRYDVYVRSICSSADTSNWSFVTSFVTDCDMVSTLPYTQNFSGWGVGSGARPACWSCGGYSSYPYIMDVTDGLGNTIGQTLYIYSYGGNQVYASLPEIDSITYPIHSLQTVFQAWSNSTYATTYSHDVIVGVCSTQGDLTTFTPADTITLTNVPAFYEVAFDALIGAGKYVTFVSVPNGGASYNYVYLDSVSVELIPDCQRPNHLTASNVVATSADLAWNDRTMATQWQVEYGPHGFVTGTGTTVLAPTNPITVTGLTPSTNYDFYVRALCGGGDTSSWSRTPGQFSTLQNPATVPYFYDFETSTEWDNWQTCSNTTINWYRDTAAGNGTNGFNTTGTHAMYVSADTGATYSTNYNAIVNAAAYRDIDFGPIDSSYLLTIRAKAGGTTSQGYDGLMVFLVDPAAPVVASSANITSPWGDVRDLTPLIQVRCATNYNTYTAILDTLTGVHRLAFFWFNQATASIATPINSPAAVDDISIDYIACPRPAGVRASQVTMASAEVVWHGPESADYRVMCRSNTGNIVANELIHTNHVHYNNLTPGTRYNVYVRRLCSADDSSTLSLAGSFTTPLCNDGFSDTIGTASTSNTTYYIPANNYYNYSYCQQIVLASELQGAGEISAINFYYAGSTAMTAKTACTIYVGHTTLSSFASTSDFAAPDSMQMVYTGNLNCSQGWNRFQFNTPFTYNGTSNIVIAIDDNSGGYGSTAQTFSVSPTGSTMALSFYSDASNPAPTSRAALDAFTGSRITFGYRNVMSFELCPANSCPTPILRDPIIRSTGVTLRWRNTGSSYQVGYRLANTSSWISDNITVTDTFYTLNHVYPMTDYVYHVRQYCDSTGISNWSTGTFNSSNIPCLSPMDLHVTAFTNRSATLYWTPEENNLSYRLHVFNSYYDRTVTTYGHHGTVNGLDGNMTYYAAVQAECQDFDEPSQWSDTIRFTTDVCPDATDLTVLEVLGNSVRLDWTEGGRADQWEIQWGLAGFPQGEGISVITDTHPYTLTGLTGETDYDIYVRGICGNNFYSEHWSNGVSITTLYSSINGVADDARVRLHPNPTSADVELTLPAMQGNLRVQVMDVSGRVHLDLTLPGGTETTTLPASQWAQGTYFVRVTGDTLNTVKKLIVR